jgi:hypothetical protein
MLATVQLKLASRDDFGYRLGLNKFEPDLYSVEPRPIRVYCDVVKAALFVLLMGRLYFAFYSPVVVCLPAKLGLTALFACVYIDIGVALVVCWPCFDYYYLLCIWNKELI